VLKVELETKPQREVEVWAALTEDGLSTKVTDGPNEGRTLAHAATVRTWVTMPEPKPEGTGYTTQVRLKLGRGWKRERLRAVVALQKPWGGRVQGAATAPLRVKR
jgi:hypothetical protein